TISLQENKIEELSLYPNPGNSLIQVSSKNSIILEVSVLDMNGRLILKSDESNFDSSTFKSGVYFVKVETNFGLKTLRFIKN
ncbi:MAG: T9SS type A sorting domain-containing protein, partial [Fluviicola sp.]